MEKSNLLTEEQHRLLVALVDNMYDTIIRLRLHRSFAHAILGGLLAACAQYWELPDTEEVTDELSGIAARITEQYIRNAQATRRRLQA